MTLLALELGVGPALAAELKEQPKVAVRVSSCSEPFEAALRRMLAIELGDLLVDERRESTRTVESIEVACEADRAKISASNVAGDQVAHNDLPFDAFPRDAAPRAVALAALEALRAVDPALTERLAVQRAAAPAGVAPSVPASATPTNPPLEPTARSAPAETTAPAERMALAPPSPQRAVTRITVGGSARHFVSAPATTLLGVRLELSRRFSLPLDAGLDLDGGVSEQRVRLGTVGARLLSSAAWLAARAGGTDWSASAGFGGRAGLVQLQGAPTPQARGHRVLRPLVGALLMLRADGTVGTVALAIAGEGGYALAGAQGLASGAPALRLDGIWLAISANAGLRLSL
jgi:hypothetical protein